MLHLSCHGDNAWRGAAGEDTPQPVLLLEDAKGAAAPTPAAGWRDGSGKYRHGLLDALGTYRPRLLFLSACLTAAAGEAGSGKAAAALSDRRSGGAGLGRVGCRRGGNGIRTGDV